MKVTDNIVDQANYRYLRGNPPKSDKSDAIADEIIWELVLSNVSDDLTIVTGDHTYFDHISFLKLEFTQKIGKQLIITKKLGDAIKKLGQIPSNATEEFDKENENRISLWIPEGWEIDSIEGDMAIVKRNSIKGRTPIRNHSTVDMCYRCGNYGPWNGDFCCSCGYRRYFE